MLEIEVVSHANGIVEVDYFFHRGAGVVGVQRVVDESAFNHDEESFGRHLQLVLEASPGDERQREVLGDAVDGVANVVDSFGGVQQHQFVFVLVGFVAFRAVGNGVTGFGEDGFHVLLAFGSLAAQASSGKHVVAASSHILRNVVEHVSLRHMGIESARGGIVGVDRCGNGNAVAAVVQLLGDAGHRVAVAVYAKRRVVGLMPGGECGAGSSRIGDGVAVRIRGGIRSHRELQHQQRFAGLQHGAVVGFGA